MSYQPSLSASSVRSYQQLDSPRRPQPATSLLQRLHTHAPLDRPGELARNRSLEAEGSRLLGRTEEGGEERRELLESAGSSSRQKYTRELTILQN